MVADSFFFIPINILPGAVFCCNALKYTYTIDYTNYEYASRKLVFVSFKVKRTQKLNLILFVYLYYYKGAIWLKGTTTYVV